MSEYIIKTTNMPEYIREALSVWYEVKEPIVRCRDCEHNARGICKVFDYCDIPNLDNGFCAWGERRNYG